MTMKVIIEFDIDPESYPKLDAEDPKTVRNLVQTMFWTMADWPNTVTITVGDTKPQIIQTS